MKIILSVLLCAFAAQAIAQVNVRPHYRQDGTYVDGHRRTAPNGTTYDNYSTQGNYNPYTGKQGTTPPEYPRY